jgi:long-chain fatty acid transport protein
MWRVGAGTVLACWLLTAIELHAANGLNLIGVGAESATMGGADVAVARDTTALVTNPAGLTQIPGHALDFFSAVAYGQDVRHLDRFGNDRNVSNRWVPTAGFGYAQRIAAMCSAGVAASAQGGAGYIYKNVATAFGTRDELSGLVGIFRPSIGLGCDASENLTLGASLALLVATAEQRFFPNTSTPSFFGLELDNATAAKPALKLGLRYRLRADLTFGATFSPRVSLPLTDGKLTANMSAIGLDRVTYRNARIDGLGLPKEIGLGLAWRARKHLLVSVEYTFLNWARSLRTSTLSATDPDNPSAPPALSATSTLGWKNQHVFAIGAAYDLSERTVLRVGFNYGRNPIPARHTSPLLASIGERHYTFGIGYRLAPKWELSGGVEYQRGDRVVFTNPELPFGENAQERANYPVFHAMLSRRW